VNGFPAHAERLDCLQANIALLADRYHGAATHLRLGAVLRFAPRPLAEGPLKGPLTVEPTLDQQLSDAADLLGLAVTDRRRASPGAGLAATEDPICAVADAYHLPWVRYHGTKHVEHSFLAEQDGDGGVVISDAYHNDTQRGQARPLRRPYSPEGFAALLDELPEGAETIRFAPRPLAPRPEPGYAPGSVEVAEVREGRFAVESRLGADGAATQRASLAGPLCTPGDLLGREIEVPAGLRPGDVVAIPNAGAYGPTASLLMFLGRRAPAEAVVRGDEVLSVSRVEHIRTYQREKGSHD
jgi:hypothetical protein